VPEKDPFHRFHEANHGFVPEGRSRATCLQPRKHLVAPLECEGVPRRKGDTVTPDTKCDSMEELDKLLWTATLTSLRDRWRNDDRRWSTENLITVPASYLDN
jgi:hypothetical protein